MNSDKFVTIFADASHCPNTKAGGYGGWVKYGYPAHTLRVHGPIEAQNSSEAEFLALIHTLAEVQRNRVWVTDKIVVIQSDCRGALDKLAVSPLINWLRAEAHHVKFKHVKGHQGNSTPRSAVNTWCDKQAREWMLLGRAKYAAKHGNMPKVA